MDIEKLIEQYMQAADKWEKRHPVTDTFDLRVQDALRDAATALSTLQTENKKLRAELEQVVQKYETAVKLQVKMTEISNRQMAELEQVKAERDAAVEAVKNMAEYIDCAGRVDYYLCDEISQEHHLKYQPKNDGNYDNEPCYKCIADWFLQGHKWQENC